MRLRFVSILALGALVAAHEMGTASEAAEEISTASSSIDWATVTPMAHPKSHHGTPILQESNLTPQQQKYWQAYNTTTYFTLSTPYKPQLWIHVAFLVFSFAAVYPFVLVLNNLGSNWFLLALTVHGALNIVSTIAYSIFITHVPDMYPNMAYSKMVTGLFVLTIIHYVSALIYVAKRWLEGGPRFPAASHYVPLDSNDTTNDNPFKGNIPMADFGSGHRVTRASDSGSNSPSQTLYDQDDSLDLDSVPPLEPSDQQPHTGLARKRDSLFEKVFSHPLISKSVRLFGFVATVVFRILNFGMLFYFLVMAPTGVACLNLMGQGNKVFNLLAHFIKGGVFFTLGLFALGRYLGAFSRMGGAWNYAYVTKEHARHSLWLRLQPKGTMITFEMIESSLILFYGSTNVFLEHLAGAGGAWTAKDLQHISIAFMYIGAGLCGVLTEVGLKKWRSAKFFDQVGDLVDGQHVTNVTPGFSPNPFPAFTIFWTGLLMSQHAQASHLSTMVHVQWGSLLTYGSFFRVFTFLIMCYYPLKDRHACFNAGRPLTELVTSFCLLCGGFVFMQSTDQVIEAMEYRGLTPMFTLNVSVGVIALLMAWIFVIFGFKSWLKTRMYGEA